MMYASRKNISTIEKTSILQKCAVSLDKVESALKNEIPGDLLAMDIRESLDLLGEITGSISNDELLGHIFSNFCIGK